MLDLRNRLMNGVVFAVPGGGTGAAAPAGDQQQQDNNDAGDQGGDDAAQNDAGDQGGEADQGGDADDNVVESEGGETDNGGTAAGDPPATPQEDWRDKELRRKHAQTQAAKNRAAELERENAELRELAARANKKPGEAGDDQQPSGQTGAGLTQADVEAAAARLQDQRDFNAAANAADQKGRETYKKDWDKATETLKTLGGFTPEQMQDLLATDDPAKVLYTLGSKPDEYHRIMDLPPAKRLAEMVKISLPAPKPKNKPSQAAAPVTPVQGRTRTGGNELRDDLSDDDWYARRRAQKEARWAAKTGKRA